MGKAKLGTKKANRRTALVRAGDTSAVLDKPIEQFMAGLDLAPDVHRMTSGMVIGEQTKYVSWEIDQKKFDYIDLLQITDVQFGHVRCKYDRVLEYRDWVLAEDHRMMIWTGDMVDAWAMWSPGRGFEQIGDPMSQIFKFCEIWAPARHRVLGYVGGNHERRAIPGFGDLGVLLAALLRIPYSNGRQLIDIYFGKHQPFQISQWHGRGGARTKGTVAQTLHRFAGEGDSQLYLMGHLHQPMIIPGWKEVRDKQRQRIVAKKYIAALGSSFMDLWGSYGEVAGYGMSDVLMPMTRLDAAGGWEVVLR
jgi:hypothetical protein